jgi:hypothetical protein
VAREGGVVVTGLSAKLGPRAKSYKSLANILYLTKGKRNEYVAKSTST